MLSLNSKTIRLYRGMIMVLSKDITRKDIGNGILMVGDSKFVSSKAVSITQNEKASVLPS